MSSNILSKREQQIFELIVFYKMSRKEIAKTLGISVRTVEENIMRIRRRAIRDGKIRIRKSKK